MGHFFFPWLFFLSSFDLRRVSFQTLTSNKSFKTTFDFFCESNYIKIFTQAQPRILCRISSSLLLVCFCLTYRPISNVPWNLGPKTSVPNLSKFFLIVQTLTPNNQISAWALNTIYYPITKFGILFSCIRYCLFFSPFLRDSVKCLLKLEGQREMLQTHKKN